MEQELKEFIEETKLKIPSHFGRITAPTIKNGDKRIKAQIPQF